jgi:glycosyltransferase involved in cell wall biosynthesis
VRVAVGAVAGTLGGPATYAVELVRALASEFPDDEFTVITDAPEVFSDFAETVRVPLASAWHQPLWDHLGVARALARGRFDLYHGTKEALPRWGRTPCVITLYDLSVRVMPETFSRAQRIHLRLETPSALRRAKAVITISKSSATDLRRFFPRVSPKLHVIPLAARPAVAPATEAEIAAFRRAHGLSGPAIGYFGTLQPRKNVDVLVEAFLRAAGDRPWRLLLAGRLRPGYRPSCLDGSDERVAYLGPLRDEELPAFLGTLACMVSPSSYEGFGLSFLEAMAAGCPVVGVANSSVPEVVGDAGVLVPRVDPDLLADAIETVVTDVGLAADLSRRGVERAGLFSWRETARRTRAVYAGVIGESARERSEAAP